MAELTWEKLRSDGLAAHMGNPERRKATARKLPSLIAHHLAELDEEGRSELATQALSDWWPSAMERCAGARDHYWPELLSLLAVTLTLLHGELPDSVGSVIRAESDLLARYQVGLVPFQRFVLLVADRCEPVRVFIGQPPSSSSGELVLHPNIEDLTILKWCLVPPRSFVGRSHTGMLALCALERAGALRLPMDRPFAATAELDADGRTLKSVAQLAEKKRGWHAQFPNGVLLTAPPYEESIEKWKVLFSSGSDESELSAFLSKSSHNSTRSKQDAQPNEAESWICAGSLDEASEKLAALNGTGSQNALIEPLRAWDGNEIPPNAVISVSIHDDYKDSQKISQIPAQDLLFNLVWSLRYRAASRPRFWTSQDEGRTHEPRPPLSRLLHQVSNAETSEEKAEIWAAEEDLLPTTSGASRRQRAAVLNTERLPEDGSVIARGAIFYGAPGSGKSVWSQCITSSFVRGALGLLGMAVRVGARRLSQALDGVSSDASLLDHLCGLNPARSSLLKLLYEQQRLFVMIDGLDEVSAASLSHIGRLLQSFRAPFLATTRDAHHPLESFPPFLRYRIQPLDVTHVSQFLRAMQRNDLREQLCIDQAHGQLKFRELSPPVLALCETPLTLALLCHVVRRGEQLSAMRYSDLYQRAFQARLTRATTERRLSESQVEMLRRTVSKVLGELALSWLLAQGGYITDETIIACLEENEITGQDAIRYQQALEHGNLLVPGDSRREFAHKTLAEWSAARALELDVQRRVARANSERQRIDYARIEVESINGLVGTREALHDSPLRQTILFFASWSRAPLALVKRALTVAASSHNRGKQDAGEMFSYARELATQASWQDADAARTVWALLVRREIFPKPYELQDEDYSPRGRQGIDQGESAPLAQLSQQFSEFLPKERGELISLVAQTVEQRATLEADITLLLPFCTSRQEPAFASVLTDGSPWQIARVLTYYERWQVRISVRTLDRLCQSVIEIQSKAAMHWQRVSNHEVAVEELPDDYGENWDNPHSKMWFGSQEYLREVNECETRIYSICASLGHLPPRAILHRRLLQWPKHLVSELNRLWAVLLEISSDGELRDRLIILLDEQAALEQAAAELFANIVRHPMRDAVAGALCGEVDRIEEVSRYGMGLWQSFRGDAKSVGWDLPHKASSRNELGKAGEHLWRPMLAALEARADAQHFLNALLKLLLAQSNFEQRAMGLWTGLPDDPPYKAKLIRAFVTAGQFPACIDLDLLIASLEPKDFGDRKIFAPNHTEALTALAESGIGRMRFCALWWRRGEKHGHDLEYWEPFLSEPQDFELVELVKGHIRSLYLSEVDKARLFPDEANDAEILAEHVRGKRPGWEAKLLAALYAAPDTFGEPADSIYHLIEDSKLAAAVPELRRRVLLEIPTGYSRLAHTLLVLDAEPSSEVIDALMRWPAAWLPDSVFGKIRENHIPALLNLRSLPPHNQLLLPLLKELSGEHLELVQSRLAALQVERGEIRGRQVILKQQRDAELHTGVEDASTDRSTRWEMQRQLDERNRQVEHWLQILERVAFSWYCKRYPTLQDLCTYLEKEACGNLKDDVAVPLQARLGAPSEAEPLLRNLLRHPEEYLRQLAYRVLLERTPPSAQIEVIMSALDAHLAFSPRIEVVETRRSSRWDSRNETEVEKQYGHTGDLIEHLRERMTAAHRAAFKRLVHAEHPLLRARAASWLAELGSHQSLPMVRMLIADVNPKVCAAALRAFAQLTLPSERTSILDCDRSAWTSVHYTELMRWLFHERRPLSYTPSEFRDRKRPSIAIESPDVLAVLLRATLTSFAMERMLRSSDNVAAFMMAVSQWENLAARLDADPASDQRAWLGDEELLKIAIEAPEPVRAALYRRLVGRGTHFVRPAVDALLSSGNIRDRILGAECHLLSGAADLVETISQIWSNAFNPPDETPRRVWGEDRPADFSVEDRTRLARALLQAAPEHIALTEFVARQIYESYDEDPDGVGGDTYVNDPESVKILRILVHRHGYPAAQAVLRGIAPSEVRPGWTGSSHDTFEWAARVFGSRPDIFPQLLTELEVHTEYSGGLKQLYDSLAEPTSDEVAQVERTHLRSDLLPPDWGEEA